jgi:hypothetical protein
MAFRIEAFLVGSVGITLSFSVSLRTLDSFIIVRRASGS